MFANSVPFFVPELPANDSALIVFRISLPSFSHFTRLSSFICVISISPFFLFLSSGLNNSPRYAFSLSFLFFFSSFLLFSGVFFLFSSNCSNCSNCESSFFLSSFFLFYLFLLFHALHLAP